MNPLLLAGIVSAASAGMSAIANYQGAKAEAAAAGQNAEIARDNAARVRRDAAMAEEAKRVEARKALGRAAAAGAQSGVAGGGLGAGSIAGILGQSSREYELDALNIRYGGESEAHANLVQASQFDAERKAALQRAKGAIVTGVLGTASAALSGYADYKASVVARKTMQPTIGAPKPASSAPRPRATYRRHYSTLPSYGGR